jgi:hypothetical protein
MSNLERPNRDEDADCLILEKGEVTCPISIIS